MFDASLWELMLILVIGLLVVGPERLPGVARTVGRWVGQARRIVSNARADIERELRAEDIRQMMAQQNEEIRELKDQLSTVSRDSQREIREIVKNAREKVNTAQDHDTGEAPNAVDSKTTSDENTARPTQGRGHDI